MGSLLIRAGDVSLLTDRARSATLLLSVLLAAAPVAAGDQRPVIDPAVRQALTGGTARVIVELRVAGMPPGAIAAAQQHVIDALAGTPFRVSRRYATVPLLGLEIGVQSLAVLERLTDLVARVVPDGTRSPASSTTPPQSGPSRTAAAGPSA